MRIASGQLAGQARAVGVVDVDHGQLGPGLEQPALGEEVVLHVGVEVEVVLGEVGEHGDRPVDRVGAVQGERVARDLHDDRLVAGARACRRRCAAGRSPRAWCARRRAARPPTMAVTVPSRPVERPPASSSARTRKAVVVLPLVPVIPTVVRRAVGSPASAAAAGAIAARTSSTRISGTPRLQRALHDERHGAARDGVVGEVVAVAGEARHAEEQRARASPARLS